eukprot:3750936-Ditylum_brightwellii.AAC.2
MRMLMVAISERKIEVPSEAYVGRWVIGKNGACEEAGTIGTLVETHGQKSRAGLFVPMLQTPLQPLQCLDELKVGVGRGKGTAVRWTANVAFSSMQVQAEEGLPLGGIFIEQRL